MNATDHEVWLNEVEQLARMDGRQQWAEAESLWHSPIKESSSETIPLIETRCTRPIKQDDSHERAASLKSNSD